MCYEKALLSKCSLKGIKLPSLTQIVGWLNAIAIILPKVLEIIDMIPKPTPKPDAQPV